MEKGRLKRKRKEKSEKKRWDSDNGHGNISNFLIRNHFEFTDRTTIPTFLKFMKYFS